jgi:two-component sensor histidine kinase
MTSSSINVIPHGDRAGNWQFLLDAIERLSLARRIEDVVAVVRDNARILAGADGVCFVLRDGELCHYVEENAIGPLWKGRKFPMSACISGWAMLNRATAVIPDIYRDSRIPYDAYRPTFVQSLVMVPVRRQDPIAAIGIYWSFRHTPDEECVRRIEALARSTATALENVGLYDSLRAELDRAREQAGRMQSLVNEINHRVKNTLSVVQSICLHSVRGAQSLDGFSETFTGRIVGLSRVHDLLTRNAWSGVELRELIEQVLGDGAAGGRGRFASEGSAVLLPPKAAVALGIALQELAANSARHGAWSCPDGKVSLVWHLEPQGEGEAARLRIGWIEQGGPAVGAPKRRGFGTRLLSGIAQELDGDAALDYQQDGFRYRFSMPLPALQLEAAAAN